MSKYQYIFNRKLLEKKLNSFQIKSIPDYEKKLKIIKNWKYSILHSDLHKTKEEAVQGDFLTHFFTEVLGYKKRYGNKFWNITQEQKTKVDGTKADGALGFFTESIHDIRAVIELKDAKTNLDKKQISRNSKITPVEQAFSYASKSGKKCNWVILSNFIEIRLYHSSDQSEYEVFKITDLDDEKEFARFYFLLSYPNLLNRDEKSATELLFEQNETEQQLISNKFYRDYKSSRLHLFEHFKAENPEQDELLLFEKTQKIMDRFIFVCFCEDNGLLPENIFRKVIQAARVSFDLSETKIWDQLKGLFHSIDKGNPPLNINRFNGGLFKFDADLDNLIMKDHIFSELEKIADYDFGSDLDVNILGHIFEHGISDIEEIKSEILHEKINKKQGKRKRDGIFYTPDYVTKYIVQETIGGWLEDRRKELREEDLPVILEETKEMKRAEKAARTKAINRHITFWTDYQEALANIKVLDPACGSGAFLNQAFDYLYNEGQRVNKILSELKGGQVTLFDLDTHILKNNLYGVDLNKESVEITKLSLWLKTANKHDPLTSLDENVLYGNSLIPDKEIAGEYAFDWQQSFPTIMENGGFDVLIGNPPYGAELNKEQKEYISKHYETQQYNFDTYTLFMELSFKLVKQEAYIGLITPNTYLVVENGSKLRDFLFTRSEIKELVEIFHVFPDAVVEPIISIFKVVKPKKGYSFKSILVPKDYNRQFDFLSQGKQLEFRDADLFKREHHIFHYRESELERKLVDKIFKNSKPLVNFADVTTGIKPYQKGKGNPKQTKEIVETKPFTSFEKQDDDWVPLIRGTEVNRYLLKWSGEYIKYGKWLAEPRVKEIFFKPKLFIRRTDDNLMAVFDDTHMVGVNSIHSIQVNSEEKEMNEKYLLALVNSTLINWVFRHENFHMVGKPLAEVKVVYVERLPIVKAKKQAVFIEKVDQLLEKNRLIYGKGLKFVEYLTNLYGLTKVSVKFLSFYELNFAEFIKELGKQKIKLTEVEKFNLMELFNNLKSELLNIKSDIIRLDEELDQMVFNLYGLSREEQLVVLEGVKEKQL